MSKFKVGDIVITNNKTPYSWGAGYKGRVISVSSHGVDVNHAEFDRITDDQGITTEQVWNYFNFWVDKVEEPVYDKERVAEFKKMLDEYRKLFDPYYRYYGKHLEAWLDEQVEPEYPAERLTEEQIEAVKNAYIGAGYIKSSDNFHYHNENRFFELLDYYTEDK